MTTLPTLRAARDAADTRWHEAAVAASEAELVLRRAASGDEREAADVVLRAAESAARDAEGVYIAADLEYQAARDAQIAEMAAAVAAGTYPAQGGAS